MEEVGLTGLTSILRGGVRIEKNPKLCYERDIRKGGTIDWRKILSKKGDSSGGNSDYYSNNMIIKVILPGPKVHLHNTSDHKQVLQ